MLKKINKKKAFLPLLDQYFTDVWRSAIATSAPQGAQLGAQHQAPIWPGP